MRLITVARKPPGESVAACTLRWGTGGINVDECRLFCEGGSPAAARRETAKKTGTVPFKGRTAQESQAEGRLERRGDPEKWLLPRPSEKLGRWPANLILQHDPACSLMGTAKVKGSPTSKTFHEAYDGESTTGIFRGVSHPGNQHADSDGKETVDKWECVNGCPVKELDKVTTYKAGNKILPPDQARSDVVYDGGWKAAWQNLNPGRNDLDSSKPSRFFKQVQGKGDTE